MSLRSGCLVLVSFDEFALLEPGTGADEVGALTARQRA